MIWIKSMKNEWPKFFENIWHLFIYMRTDANAFALYPTNGDKILFDLINPKQCLVKLLV